MRIFTYAVNGKFIREEDFVLTNTEIPTDTFNILLAKTSQIKNIINSRSSIENMHLKEYPFSTWMDSRYLNANWQDLMQKYDLKEAERNIMMKLENTLNVGQRNAHQLSEVNLDSEIQNFIGRVGEITLSTGLLIDSKNSYGIYDVMTKETFRGKGYGSGIFQYLLTQTKDQQKPVVLQASVDGKNIYKCFGFKNIGEMVVFE